MVPTERVMPSPSLVLKRVTGETALLRADLRTVGGPSAALSEVRGCWWYSNGVVVIVTMIRGLLSVGDPVLQDRGLRIDAGNEGRVGCRQERLPVHVEGVDHGSSATTPRV